MANSYNELFGVGAHSSNANLKAWLLCQDSAASTAVADQTGSHNGTLQGGNNTSDISTTGPNSWLTSALQLDGSADYITITDHADFDFGTATDFTVMCRADPSTTTQSLIDKADSSGTGGGWNVHFNAGVSKGRQYIYGGGGGADYFTADAATDFSGSGWVSYAVSFARDGNAPAVDILAYLNGSAESMSTNTSNAASTDDVDNSENVRIGVRKVSGSLTNYLNGPVCDVGIFATLLAASDVAQWHNGPELNYSSGVSFASNGAFNIGTWALPSPFASGSNGSQTQEVIAVNAAGSVLDTATTATGTLDLSSEAGNTCYLLARVSNTGGYDIGDKATRTSAYGSSNDGYYEIASVTAAGGGVTQVGHLMLLGVG